MLKDENRNNQMSTQCRINIQYCGTCRPEHYIMRMNELQFLVTTWMDLTNIMLGDRSQTFYVYCVLHLYKIQKQAKLIYGIRQNNDYPWGGKRE